MIKSNQIIDFIKSVRDGIKESSEDNFQLVSSLDFELAFTIQKDAKGGIDILIVDTSANYQNTTVSKIKFSMGTEKSMDMGLKPLLNMFNALSQIDNNSSKSNDD